MEEYPELPFLSPNERESYISKQLKKAQIARMAEAKKQYSAFQIQRCQQYLAEKQKHEEKKKCRLDPEHRKQKLEEKANLKARMEIQQRQFGMAQKCAKEENNKEKISQEVLEKQAKERKALEKERFEAAMKQVYDEDPKRQFEQLTKRVNSARETAKLRENEAIQNYVAKAKRIQQEEEEQARKDAEQEKQMLHPKLTIDDYARSYYHTGIGVIPVTQESEDYAKQLEDHKTISELEEKKRNELINRRSRMAARFSCVQKDTSQLAQELEEIRAYETNERLMAMLSKRSEMPIDKLYNQDEQYQKWQDRIDRFLLVDDEAPIPRGRPPQPQPLVASNQTSAASSECE